MPFREIIKKIRNDLNNYSSVYQNNDTQNETEVECLDLFKKDLIEKLNYYCDLICNLIIEKLLPNEYDTSKKAFYHLILGDFYRYKAEFEIDSDIPSTYLSFDNY